MNIANISSENTDHMDNITKKKKNQECLEVIKYYRFVGIAITCKKIRLIHENGLIYLVQGRRTGTDQRDRAGMLLDKS